MSRRPFTRAEADVLRRAVARLILEATRKGYRRAYDPADKARK
jgi:hypothetical protein